MQTVRSLTRVLFSQPSPKMCVPVARLQVYPPPVKKDIEYPDRMKPKVISRVPQYPTNMRALKMQKKLRLMRGEETVHNFLLHKQYGIIATRGGRLKAIHMDMMRVTFLRKFKDTNVFAIWRVDEPWQPVTKKSQGQRMGSGKGSIDHYVTPVKAGRVLMEVGGDCEYFEVKRMLQNIAAKLPFPAMAVSQEILEEMKQKEKHLEESNLHPWTWKYMVQNNMLGCHNWISDTDKKYFSKHL